MSWRTASTHNAVLEDILAVLRAAVLDPEAARKAYLRRHRDVGDCSAEVAVSHRAASLHPVLNQLLDSPDTGLSLKTQLLILRDFQFLGVTWDKDRQARALR